METITRRERKERTREGLLEKAEELFASRGIAATKTADVAAALEVSHGTVFLHFPTREDLVLEVIERFGESLAAEIGRRIWADMPLEAMLRAHLRVLAEREDFYARLISEAPFLPAGARDFLSTVDGILSERFHGAARAAMRDGTMKSLAPMPFFTTWTALVNHLVMNRDRLTPGKSILKELEEQLIKHFFALIRIAPSDRTV